MNYAVQKRDIVDEPRGALASRTLAMSANPQRYHRGDWCWPATLGARTKCQGAEAGRDDQYETETPASPHDRQPYLNRSGATSLR